MPGKQAPSRGGQLPRATVPTARPWLQLRCALQSLHGMFSWPTVSPREFARCCYVMGRLWRLLQYILQVIAARSVLHVTKVVSYELLSLRQSVFGCVSSGILEGCDVYLPQVQLVADSSIRLSLLRWHGEVGLKGNSAVKSSLKGFMAWVDGNTLELSGIMAYTFCQTFCWPGRIPRQQGKTELTMDLGCSQQDKYQEHIECECNKSAIQKNAHFPS